MADANLLVKIGALVDSSFDRATRTAVGRIQKLGTELSTVGASFSLGLTAPIVAFGAAAINAGKEIESLKLALQSIEGSAAGAERRFRELQEVAKLPGLGVREAIQADLALRAYGLTADRAKEATLAFGNALASAGRGKADLAETVRQFGQLSAAGKLTAENLKPIIERVPQVAKILQKEFGQVTAEALRDLGVTSQQVIDVIIGGLQKLPPVADGLKNALENFSDTTEQALAKVGDALAPFISRFLKDFAEPAIEKVQQLAISFSKLSPETQNFGVAAVGLAASLPVIALGLGKVVGIATEAVALFARFPALGIGAVGVGLAGFAKVALDNISSVTDALEKTQQRFDVFQQSGKAGVEAFDQFKVYSRDVKGAAEEWKSLNIKVDSGFKVIDQTAKAGAAAAGSLKTVGQQLEKIRVIRFEERSILNAVIAQESSAAVSRTVSRLVELRAELERIRNLRNPLESVLAFSGKSVTLAGGPLDFLQQQFDAAEKQFKFTEESITLSTRATKDLVSEIAKVPGETQLVEDAWARVAGVINRVPDSIRVFNRSQTQAAINAGKEASKEFDKAQREQERSAREAQRHIERYFHRTAQAIGDVIFSAKSAGQAITQFGREILKSLATAAIEAQLKRLTKVFLDFGASLGATGIGKVLGGIFGADLSKNAGGLIIKNATGAATSAASGAAGAAASASGAAGSVASSIASSGLSAAVGAVASAVTAVSSVISNFQLAGVNKSLDLIEKEVRYSQIHLLHILENSNKYWPWIQFAHDRLKQLVDGGIGVYNAPGWGPVQVSGTGSGSGPSITIDLRGSTFSGGTTRESVEEMFTQAARHLVLAGAVAG